MWPLSSRASLPATAGRSFPPWGDAVNVVAVSEEAHRVLARDADDWTSQRILVMAARDGGRRILVVFGQQRENATRDHWGTAYTEEGAGWLPNVL
jgi:hypothetical protein